jgi:WD40 repeat protein
MHHRFSWVSVFFTGLTAVAAPFATSVSMAEDKVNFEDHVKPILREKCLSCHNTNKKTSDLDLSSYASLMQGGAAGASIEAGDSGASYLYSLVSHQSEPFMPPNADKLPDATLDIIKKWIDGGAPETSSSKVTLPKKKNTAMTVDVVAGARPAGDPPMPDVLNVEPVVHTAATTAVTAIATNPWSKLTAVAGQKQVVLYHTESLEPLGVLPFPEGTPRVLKFSRNGAMLLAGGGHGAAKGLCVVWDIKTGERVMTVGDELDEVLAADISADQSMVALGGPEKIVRVYNTLTGELAYDCRKHTDWIYSLEFSPDGVLLATTDRSGGLLVWEAHTGREYLTLTGHTAAVTSVSWRIDGNVLASASEDTTIRLWEMENGGQIKSWGAHGGGVFSVEYTRDGRIVSSGRDRVTKLWDGNGTALKDFEAFSDLALQVTHCDETNRVIAGDWTGEVRVWNAVDGARIGQLTTNPPTLESRLSAAQALVAPVAEKLATANTERDAALAAQTLQTQMIDAANVAWTGAQKKFTDQQALITVEEQKLVAEQAKDQTLTTSISALQKAIPDLKIAAEKSAAALEITPADEDLKKVVEQLKMQFAARDAELKTSETELVTTKANVVSLTSLLAAQKQQLTVDEQAMVAAKGVLDIETAALPAIQEAAAAKEQALAAVQQEVNRTQALVTRWQHYIALRDELAALDAARIKRDEVQLKSLEAESTLQEKQQQIAASQESIQSAIETIAANDQKKKDLTTSVTATDAQKAAQAEVMTKTQTAVPILKAALAQATAALAALPDNAEIKSATDNLAAVADRQEKAIVTMTEQIAAFDASIATMKAEIEAAAAAMVNATEMMQLAEKTKQTLTAEIPTVEAIVTGTSAELKMAEQAVEAAATVVETRRQVLRPQLQLSSAN